MPSLPVDDYLDRILDDFELARSAAFADPLRNVPTTPEWNTLSTFGHLAQNLAYTAATITGDPSDREAVEHPPLRDDLVAWLADYDRWARRGLTTFVNAVREGRDRDDVPNFTRRNTTATFWARQMCHHTTIHAWDVTNAVGTPLSIPAQLAADQLEALFDDALPHWIIPRIGPQTAPALQVAATDADFVRVVALRNGVVTTPGRAAHSLAAPAAQLLLALMSRAAVDPADDTPVVRRWQAICSQ